MTLKQRFMVGVLAALIAWTPANADSFDNIVFFGDSLSDTGNVWWATGGPGSGFPPAPYNQGSNGAGPDMTGGQWSDPLGPSWPTLFAANYGLFATPSLVGGNNYAWGGARTGANPDIAATPWLDQQVAQYLGGGAAGAATTLASIMMGGNDLANPDVLAAFAIDDIGALMDGIASIVTSLTDLYAAGIRNFLVASVPDIGATPSFQELDVAAPGTAALATAAVMTWNGLLAGALDALVLPDADIFFLDLFVLADDDLLAAAGITNTTDACLTAVSICDDPASYLYWDPFHPSSTAHALIADAAVASVPEPGTLALLAFGLAGLGLARRRRQA